MERAPTTTPVTPMQLCVATLLALGQTQGEVAAALGIGIGTVRDHLDRIARKIPGDLPREQRVVAWVRGATVDVLEGRTLRYEFMVESAKGAALGDLIGVAE